jgi:N-dimethylarginine dimethylaminohydrolase
MENQRAMRAANFAGASLAAGLGGEGWIPRQGSLRDDQETVWSAFGVSSECGRLRAVLMRRPGAEIECVPDVRHALWLDRVDPIRAREQHDALVRLYRAHGVEVHYVGDGVAAKPNLYFMRDTFAMTPEGAILSRLASHNRAGEERAAAQALLQLGIPIVLSVHGGGAFEGADLMLVNPELAILAEGRRTNREGAGQVARLLREIGVSEVARVQLADDCLHLDCVLSIIRRDAALIIPGRTPEAAVSVLRRHGVRVLEAPSAHEAESGMAVNLVALEPGLVVMPAGNPETRGLLEGAGVTCLEVEISELMNGGGAIHCMTGVLRRED